MEKHRFYEIDALRFLAALSVMLFHYAYLTGTGTVKGLDVISFPYIGSVARYGYLGIDLFFIISGFVILLSAQNRNASGFVASRIARLYPAFWVCVSITSAAILLFPQDQFTASLPQYLMNMTMLNGLVHIEHIDQSYWTLLVELKFYFIVFMILLLGQLRFLQHILIGWFLIVSVYTVHDLGKYVEFFLIPKYAYYFIAGATAFLVYEKGPSKIRLMLFLGCYLGSLNNAIAVARSSLENSYTQTSLLLVAIIVSVYYLLFILIMYKKTIRFGRPWFVYMGVLTYPMYLLHSKIGYMSFNAFGGTVNKYVLLLSMIAVIGAASYMIHVLVEKRYCPLLKRYIADLLTRLKIEGFRWITDIKCIIYKQA